MLTIEKLKEYGADVDAGLARCMGLEDFYLRLVRMELEDKNFHALKEAMERKDFKAAFEAAHALKGAVGNLSLTPLYAPLCKLTELFRGAQSMPDTNDLYPPRVRRFYTIEINGRIICRRRPGHVPAAWRPGEGETDAA